MFEPLPHPAGECPFYRGGWQAFLVAMQPDASGTPAIVSYPTIDVVYPAIEAGVLRVLSKPVDFEELVPILEQHAGSATSAAG